MNTRSALASRFRPHPHPARADRARRRFRAFPGWAVACVLAVALPCQGAGEAYLPPAPPWHGASELLIAKEGAPWITPAEKAGLRDTPGYDDTIAWLRQLATTSPQLKLHEFGRTAQGRPLYAVLASRDGAKTPEKIAANGRPTLLAQAGIHAGEIDGKDAGLMLLRDLATKKLPGLLDHVNLVFVPVFNADGHERISEWSRPNQRGPVHQGWRTTAQNLNLNRDYTKADAPEMRAMLGLINATAPALYIDLHVTDGIDYAYDVTYGYQGFDGEAAWSPRCAEWLERVLRPAVDISLRAQGHIPGGLVFAANDRDLAEGIIRAHGSPRFSHPYGDLRHLPAILVENHSLKPYAQRVLGNRVFLEAVLRLLGEQGAGLRSAITADAATRPAKLAVNWTGRDGTNRTDFLGIMHADYVSPASGTMEVRWLGVVQRYPGVPVLQDHPGAWLNRPRAYYVPVTKPEVIDRLRLHGIKFETLSSSRSVPVEMYRLAGVKGAPAPFEGRFRVGLEGMESEPHTETFPAGSVRVSTDQPLGDLAMVLLEPMSEDSLFQWGFFNEILSRTEYIEGYVVAPMGEQMLGNLQVRAEFEAKVRADPKFAADATARLQWFYERSPYYDNRYLLYPVGIER